MRTIENIPSTTFPEWGMSLEPHLGIARPFGHHAQEMQSFLPLSALLAAAKQCAISD